MRFFSKLSTIFNQLRNVSLFPSMLLLGGMIIILVVWASLRLADYLTTPKLYFPDTRWELIEGKRVPKYISGTTGDQVADVSVFCHGITTTYTKVDPEYWPLLMASYEALEGWKIDWMVLLSQSAEEAAFDDKEATETDGIGVKINYRSPLEVQDSDSHLASILGNNTTGLFFVVASDRGPLPFEQAGIVFLHHDWRLLDVPYHNPYWGLTLPNMDRLRLFVAEEICVS